MANHSIRFGVIKDNKFQSPTWKLWTSSGKGKKDVYLACRNVAGIVKFSMHESGKWHLAYVKQKLELFDEENAPLSRFLVECRKPEYFVQGLTFACHIMIPWNTIDIPIETKIEEILWSESPSEGQTIRFSIVLTEPSIDTLQLSSNINIIDSIPVEGGGRVWVISTILSSCNFIIPDEYKPRYFKGISEEDILNQSNHVLAWNLDESGAMIFFDLPYSFPTSALGMHTE